MEKAPLPYERMIFVCTNAREDGTRVACAGPGRAGNEICERLRAAVKEKGLTGRVRVARSGCLNQCEKGPNLVIFPGGTWLAGVSPADVPGIVQLFLEDLIRKGVKKDATARSPMTIEAQDTRK